MSQVHRQGDITTGHGCWPQTQPLSYSPDIRANGKPVVRQGDTIIVHCCPSIPECHGGTYIGSSSVKANGKSIQKVGSSISCGDKAATGSPNVRIG